MDKQKYMDDIDILNVHLDIVKKKLFDIEKELIVVKSENKFLRDRYEDQERELVRLALRNRTTVDCYSRALENKEWELKNKK